MSRRLGFGSCIERVLLVLLGLTTGILFWKSCLRLAFLVAGNPLRSYKPAILVADFEAMLVGPTWETYKYVRWLPIPLLLLALLPHSVFSRCKWIVVGVFISQLVAARAFSFLCQYFRNHTDVIGNVSSFAAIRQEMTALERWIYSPLVDLLERGWGYWAIALHSIVLGAFWTLVVYGVYRLVQGTVQRRRSAEPAPRGETA